MDLYGGAELVIVRLANYMTNHGIANAVLTTSILPEIEKSFLNTEIIVQPVSRSSILRYFQINKIIALQKGIHANRKRFDLINIHNFPAELAVQSDKPAVWLCNEPPQLHLPTENKSVGFKIARQIFLSIERLMVKYLVRNVVVADEFNYNRFYRLYGFKPKIINYGVDFDYFSVDTRPSQTSDSKDFIVLQVGMIQPLKNQLESLKTIKKLKSEINYIKLIFAGSGEGEYFSEVVEYVKENQMEDYVVFTGHINREEIRNLYHSCDVLLHPIKSQGGWLSPFEALCARKPVVVSSEMTAADIIKKEAIGSVTNDYYETIKSIYKNLTHYKQMAEKGHEWVRTNLDWNQFCQKMVSLFDEIYYASRREK